MSLQALGFTSNRSALRQPCDINFSQISLASSRLNSSLFCNSVGSLPKTPTIFFLLVLESNWQYELTRRLLHYRIFCLVLRFQLLSPYLSFFARSILVFLGLSLPCISFFFLLYPRLIYTKITIPILKTKLHPCELIFIYYLEVILKVIHANPPSKNKLTRP